MSQNATPLRLEDAAGLERYLITKHKRPRIESVFDISLSFLYAVAGNKKDPDGRQDSVYVQDYFKRFL